MTGLSKAPSPEDVARAMHTLVRVGTQVANEAVRPVCLCDDRLPWIAVALTGGDERAAAEIVHAMHLQDVLDAVRGFRMSDDPPGLDGFT